MQAVEPNINQLPPVARGKKRKYQVIRTLMNSFGMRNLKSYHEKFNVTIYAVEPYVNPLSPVARKKKKREKKNGNILSLMSN